ncbi:MAG: Maf family protein [Stackebrandtia sp.]
MALQNGKVLVAGGSPGAGPLASAELYDPATGSWTPTGPLATARCEHTLSLLPNGKVLAAGGFTDCVGFGTFVSTNTAEIYDPATGTWKLTANPHEVGGAGQAVVRLRDGRVEARTEGHLATTVRFAEPTDAEIDAYLATGEPMRVAGGFTLDGFGGWFVEGVDGDPSSVIGISLPLTRKLLSEVGVSVVDLWSR